MARQCVRSVLIILSLIVLICLLVKFRDEYRDYGSGGGDDTNQWKNRGNTNRKKFDSNRGNEAGCDFKTCPTYSDPYIWNYSWDGLKESQHFPDRCLILIRHGQYAFNTGHLTDIGKKQAELTGMRLIEMNFTIDKIVHSTMDRAVETGKLLLQQLQQQRQHQMRRIKIESDPMLVEGGPIPPDPEIKYWSLPAKDYQVNGPRLEAAFKKYFHRPPVALPPRTCTILVGHGNIFRSFILRALQLPVFSWMRFFVAHSSISLVRLRWDGTNSLELIGDAGHLPYSYVTY